MGLWRFFRTGVSDTLVFDDLVFCATRVTSPNGYIGSNDKSYAEFQHGQNVQPDVAGGRR